ncbi:MAG TPA: DinB family protein [Hanamia sp.]|nr:DinB family protein [Hanamia sp.]
MEIMPLLSKELEQEANITRKFLRLVPLDKSDWKPHEKSMSMETLAVHIATLPSWIDLALNSAGIDFATTPYKPPTINTSDDLLKIFEDSLSKGKQALANNKDEVLDQKWTLRNGDQVLAEMTKYESARHSFSQTIHHRAQLGVYLRLLNIPVPGSYGPSADDPGM